VEIPISGDIDQTRLPARAFGGRADALITARVSGISGPCLAPPPRTVITQGFAPTPKRGRARGRKKNPDSASLGAIKHCGAPQPAVRCSRVKGAEKGRSRPVGFARMPPAPGGQKICGPMMHAIRGRLPLIAHGRWYAVVNVVGRFIAGIAHPPLNRGATRWPA